MIEKEIIEGEIMMIDIGVEVEKEVEVEVGIIVIEMDIEVREVEIMKEIDIEKGINFILFYYFYMVYNLLNFNYRKSKM